MKRIIASILSASTLAAITSVAMVTDAFVSIDQPTGLDRIVVNAAFMPTETANYDRLVFTCTLRQVIELPGDAGGSTEKIYEPVTFKYTRANERMVKGLRKHIHFQVPVGLEELRDKYGRLTFKFDDPVTVSHVLIEAYVGDQCVWTIERDVAVPAKEN